MASSPTAPTATGTDPHQPHSLANDCEDAPALPGDSTEIPLSPRLRFVAYAAIATSLPAALIHELLGAPLLLVAVLFATKSLIDGLHDEEFMPEQHRNLWAAGSVLGLLLLVFFVVWLFTISLISTPQADRLTGITEDSVAIFGAIFAGWFVLYAFVRAIDLTNVSIRPSAGPMIAFLLMPISLVATTSDQSGSLTRWGFVLAIGLFLLPELRDWLKAIEGWARLSVVTAFVLAYTVSTIQEGRPEGTAVEVSGLVVALHTESHSSMGECSDESTQPMFPNGDVVSITTQTGETTTSTLHNRRRVDSTTCELQFNVEVSNSSLFYVVQIGQDQPKVLTHAQLSEPIVLVLDENDAVAE